MTQRGLSLHVPLSLFCAARRTAQPRVIRGSRLLRTLFSRHHDRANLPGLEAHAKAAPLQASPYRPFAHSPTRPFAVSPIRLRRLRLRRHNRPSHFPKPDPIAIALGITGQDHGITVL
jgi:hypothetical protein